MTINEREVNGVVILDLVGKMTLGECEVLLSDKIATLLNDGKQKVLLNLEGVPYIDTAGLMEIERLYTKVSLRGGRLKLMNLSKRIADLFQIAGLSALFDTFDNDEDVAVASFNEGRMSA